MCHTFPENSVSKRNWRTRASFYFVVNDQFYLENVVSNACQNDIMCFSFFVANGNI